jgi:hypothetical protein
LLLISLFISLSLYLFIPMKKVTKEIPMWEATDGSCFQSQYDCEKHQRQLDIREHLKQICVSRVFHVTKEHLALLKRMNIESKIDKDIYLGSVVLQDNKRPYGSSDAYEDIGTIIKEKEQGVESDGSLYYTDEQRRRFELLNAEMIFVLNLLIDHNSIGTGFYSI